MRNPPRNPSQHIRNEPQTVSHDELSEIYSFSNHKNNEAFALLKDSRISEVFLLYSVILSLAAIHFKVQLYILTSKSVICLYYLFYHEKLLKDVY